MRVAITYKYPACTNLVITSTKWEISDQNNDQDSHINDHFEFVTSGSKFLVSYHATKNSHI